ncbi:MAG: YmaF family protein [Lachnospiraceae bacterium]|nr:YmaF family protein [Lachnospiraceae bacterium]
MNNQKSECQHQQKHVHEVTGSTLYENHCSDCHNHRFATVSGEAMPSGCSHIHEIEFQTDFADGHYHKFCGKSGPAVDVGCGKHVHYAKACTTAEDDHKHAFQVASLIEAPTKFECCD